MTRLERLYRSVARAHWRVVRAALKRETGKRRKKA